MPSEQIGIVDLILRQSPSFLALILLLVLSGLVSGSESALFSLTHYDRGQIRGISRRIANLVEYVLKRPEQLLLTLMVANMAVNTLYFAVSSLLVYHFIQAGHSIFAGGIGITTLLALVLFGETLSKAWMYALRIPTAVIVTSPIYLLMRVLQPPLIAVERFFITPMVRLFLGPRREKRLSKEELLTLIRISDQEKYLQPAQVDLLEKVIELRDLRVRQVMIPRVNMPAIEIHEPVDKVRDFIRRTHRSRIAIYVYQIDYIVGIIRSRRLLVEEPAYTRDILERVKFVPENQRVDQLLRFFHREHIDVAMVVDEYGGLVGMVSLEELMERTIGELRSEFPDPDAPRILPVQPGVYLVDGDMPLDAFFEQMGRPAPEDVAVDTLAGLTMHLVGHLPGPDERVEYQGLTLMVKDVDYNRIDKILVMDRGNTRDG